MGRSVSVGLVVAAVACGCTGGWHGEVRSAARRGDAERAMEAYAKLRQAEGPHGRALAHVASAVLEGAARGEDPELRDAALSELTAAGVRAEPVLERLVDAPPDDSVVRARALSVLASRGRRGRGAQLRPLLDDDDPQVQAWAVVAVDPRREGPRLLTLLAHPSAAVREAAARRLCGVPVEVQVRRGLAAATRRDPAPRVRAAAAQALAGQGEDAVEVLEGALRDRAREVRGAAAGALVCVGDRRAYRAVERAMFRGPSHDSVEVARRVLGGGRCPPAPEALQEEARVQLVTALRSGSGSLRAQAAVALRGIRGHPEMDEALRQALDEEDDDGVRLHLVHALHVRGDHGPEVMEALAALAAGEGFAAVRASAVLAEDGAEGAQDRLAHFLSHDEARVRITAARALACEGAAADRARHALGDEVPRVRVRAAGAILRCAR